MGFRFPLEVILRLRQSLEQQQEIRLREANRRVSALDRQIADVDAQLERSALREAQLLEAGVSAAEIHFAQLCLSVLRDHRVRLQNQRNQAAIARDVSASAYRQARQQREVMDALHHQQLQLYRRQSERNEQRAHDDLLLLRRAFLRQR